MYEISAGTERISAYRTCEVDSSEFRTCKENINGTFHLRFDDTNPMKEDMEFVESIKEDVKWLGADWGDHLLFLHQIILIRCMSVQ